MAAAACALCVVPALAADLPDIAARAFAEYLDKAQAAFVDGARRPAAVAPRDMTLLRSGKTVAGPGGGDGIVEAPSSLIHHWRGQAFIKGATLEQALAVSRDYASYPKVYRPIMRATVVSDAGAEVRIQFRMRASGGGLSATLDVLSQAQYVQLGRDRAYVVSRSESIREVKAAGTPTERQLPEGQDSGYLWRAGTFTRFAAGSDGVFVEMETLGLSRPFPRGLGWIIEPVARRIGRRSVDESLREFRQAVVARGRLTPGGL